MPNEQPRMLCAKLVFKDVVAHSMLPSALFLTYKVLDCHPHEFALLGRHIEAEVFGHSVLHLGRLRWLLLQKVKYMDMQ